MGDTYPGFSNGLHATAHCSNCLSDVFPPLLTVSELLLSSGKSIFDGLCFESNQGFYISNAGMGYATTFSMVIGVVTADFSLTMKVETGTDQSAVDLSVSGSVYAHIGDASCGAATVRLFFQSFFQSAMLCIPSLEF